MSTKAAYMINAGRVNNQPIMEARRGLRRGRLRREIAVAVEMVLLLMVIVGSTVWGLNDFSP
ncbi:MAG: hypothetical protein ACPLUL_12250 [Thermanaerothrix sp.]|uniref:hypothetical protein n=1 Tax=Thermanaerothrix sp. TaxID=2972675 RepID=UPI003C7A899E